MIPFHCQPPINLSISPSIEHRRFKRGTASVRLRSEGSWRSHNGVFCKLSGGRDDFLGGRHDSSSTTRTRRLGGDLPHRLILTPEPTHEESVSLGARSRLNSSRAQNIVP